MQHMKDPNHLLIYLPLKAFDPNLPFKMMFIVLDQLLTWV